MAKKTASEEKKAPAERSAPSVSDVRVLFGPGGYVRWNVYATEERPAQSLDLTRYASALASIGATVPRAVPRPVDLGSELECDLGDGGRALWVDGGGDIDGSELLWAIAAAFEEKPDEAIAAMDDINTRRRSWERDLLEAAIRDALSTAGYTTRRINGFLRRRRDNYLDGRSIREVFDQDAPTLEELVEVLVAVGVELDDRDLRRQFLHTFVQKAQWIISDTGDKPS